MGKMEISNDALFDHQPWLSASLFMDLAKSLGLDPGALELSLRCGEFNERVQRDFLGGVRSGVNGTPTFFINGVRHDANFDVQSLGAAIQRAIIES